MPLVVYQPSGHTSIAGSTHGPNSHLCLALFVLLCINPPLGLFAVIFAISSRHVAHRDWDGALLRGRISLFISIAGIVISVIAAFVFVLIFYSRDA